MRLLDAEATGVDWREAVRAIFGIDPNRSDGARSIYDSHLACARWMTTTGYRDLLRCG